MNTIDKKDKRRTQVLSHIVKLYVSQASPVSSKSISISMGDSVSSATVRNVMAELEELGFIEQPHTSAGRIPTDLGYRYYVDNIIDKLMMEKSEMERLSRVYKKRTSSINDIIEKTSSLISETLHNAGIVMCPSIEDMHLSHLELIKIKDETVLAVLVTMTNIVKNYIVILEKDVKETDLARTANFLNSELRNSTISSVYDRIKIFENENVDGELAGVISLANRIIGEIADKDVDYDVRWEGLNYFMEEPEFDDAGITKRMFEVFSDKRILAGLMKKDLVDNGLKIYIGRENEPDALRGCSFITSGYGANGKTVGRIGVLGPMRMDYNVALSTLGCLSNLISKKIEEFYE